MNTAYRALKRSSRKSTVFVYADRIILGALASLALCVCGLAEATDGGGGEAPIVVGSVEALQSALVPDNAGRRIVLRAGTYEISEPLVVPDGVSLQGKGVMMGDEYPIGIDPLKASAIVATPGFDADLITLGDGAMLSRLLIRQAEGSSGNTVVVGSRGPSDSVSATISECEIVNPNAPGAGPQGPTGRGVLVTARNPNIEADPPPHEGADLKLSMRRSVVRSTGGASAIFGINFASDASVQLVLKNNALGGGLDYAAAVSRGGPVQGSSTEVRSNGNLYFAEEGFPRPFGVRVIGGSDAPAPMGWPGADDNFASFRSRNDAIDGFAVGICAIAGNLFWPENGVSSRNTVELRLHELVLNSLEADFALYAAYVEMDEVQPGAENLISVLGRGIQGSGAGPNYYVTAGPGLSDPGYWGIGWDEGNQLLFLGSVRHFIGSNSNLNPFPPQWQFERLW